VVSPPRLVRRRSHRETTCRHHDHFRTGVAFLERVLGLECTFLLRRERGDVAYFWIDANCGRRSGAERRRWDHWRSDHDHLRLLQFLKPGARKSPIKRVAITPDKLLQNRNAGGR